MYSNSLQKKQIEVLAREIFDEYCNYVYIIAASKIKRSGTKEDIEECVSDVFAEIFRNPDILSGQVSNLKSYIGTIAKRRAIDTYRRLSVHQWKNLSVDDEVLAETASGENIEESAEIRERNSILLCKIKELGEPDSTIIIEQFYYNMKVSEIAKAISMTAASVQKRSIRAREKLKILLVDAGISL